MKNSTTAEALLREVEQRNTSLETRRLVRQVVQDMSTGGALSRSLPGYAERPAQLEMAAVVALGMMEGQHVVTEAGTGTGKSDAYLVPAVRSGKTVVLSTGNKALQDQLYHKDIPFLQQHLQPFRAALVKGFSNYVCLDRLEEERTTWVGSGPTLEHVVRQTQDAAWNGDLESVEPQVSVEVRTRVSGDPDRCAWTKCAYFDRCYQHRMRVEAQQAQVIVVNHTLLLLDAAAEQHILPKHDVSVIDECHGLEEEATRAFTVSVTASQVYTLLALKAVRAYGSETLLAAIGQQTAQVWEGLERQFEDRVGTTLVVTGTSEEGLVLASQLDELAQSLAQHAPGFLTEREEILYKKLVQRVEHLAVRVRQVFVRDQAETLVYYLERTGASSIAVCAAPLDVAPFLREHLFDVGPVVCCSATLATAKGGTPAQAEQQQDCTYFQRRVGIAGSRLGVYEQVLPLVFDFERQARLYVPRHIPEPSYGRGDVTERYQEAIAQEMRHLVEASGGRAFLLFSSRRMLEIVYARLAPQLSYPLLKQGEMTRRELVRRFRSEEGAVLFGLKSFWEGVDIAGEALSLVVIDKLPFDPPDDPVHEARVALMKANGEDWFGGYVLNGAILRLKQGVGRLIRTHTDFGVMAILDARLYSKSYGTRVFASLPPARRATTIAEITQFFEQHERRRGK